MIVLETIIHAGIEGTAVIDGDLICRDCVYWHNDDTCDKAPCTPHLRTDGNNVVFWPPEKVALFRLLGKT